MRNETRDLLTLAVLLTASCVIGAVIKVDGGRISVTNGRIDYAGSTTTTTQPAYTPSDTNGLWAILYPTNNAGATDPQFDDPFGESWKGNGSTNSTPGYVAASGSNAPYAQYMLSQGDYSWSKDLADWTNKTTGAITFWCRSTQDTATIAVPVALYNDANSTYWLVYADYTAAATGTWTITCGSNTAGRYAGSIPAGMSAGVNNWQWHCIQQNAGGPQWWISRGDYSTVESNNVTWSVSTRLQAWFADLSATAPAEHRLIGARKISAGASLFWAGDIYGLSCYSNPLTPQQMTNIVQMRNPTNYGVETRKVPQ